MIDNEQHNPEQDGFQDFSAAGVGPNSQPRAKGRPKSTTIDRDEPLQTAAAFHSACKETRGKALRRYRHTWYRWEGPNYRSSQRGRSPC